ncbi:MAG TPA: hypothetical protein VNF47_17145 [Streptosporangiaceae bacterium]|nr:hypothetical protein [Streptosporangiaceae bacterium]
MADDGGSWQASADPDGRIHGLGIVAALAAKLSTHGDADTGRVVSARFDWPA